MEAIGKAKLFMIKLTDGSAGFLMSIKVLTNNVLDGFLWLVQKPNT